MKITKVNHVKPAVSTEEKTQEGILYKNPTDGKGLPDIEKHVDDLIARASRNFKENFKYYIDDNASPEEKKKLQQKKNKFRNGVIESLKNQNMVIQPVELEEGDIQIALSLVKGELSEGGVSEKGSRKAREKAAFRRFLSDYANLDEAFRMDLLRRIRRIVLIYFYGTDSMNETIKSDFDVWDDHKSRQSDYSAYIKHEFVSTIVENKKEQEKLREENYNQLKDSIRKANINSYRSTVSYIDSLSDEQKSTLFFADQDMINYWVHHIEDEVERIYKKTKRLNKDNTYKLCKGYISEKVWKGIINYICIKYIAIGKVVYNLAMEDLGGDKDENLGELAAAFKNGISSFDYEIIKAEERLQRETAVYVSFAINNFLSATVDRGEDVKDKECDIADKNLNRLPNTKRNILQFFGGSSRWSGFDYSKYSSDETGEYLWNQVREALYSMRNESFHFNTKNIKSDWDQKLISDMFETDSRECGKSEVVKFYSNNIPMFYSETDIEKLMHKLYDNYSIRASQVPAFNTVFVRKNFASFIGEKLKIHTTFSGEELQQFQSALYYLLKEVYYNAFLTDKNTKKFFLDAVSSLNDSDKEHKYAVIDFKKRINEINRSGSFSLSEICQIIMTEYNQQNDKWMKKRTNKGKEKLPDGYQHYKMLLLESLRDAFVLYLNSDTSYSFINSPRKKDIPSKDEFLPNFSSDRYDSIVKELAQNPELQKWYVMGRFLYPKQTNQLAGSIRNYIQYKWDIKRRAENTGNAVAVSEELSNRLKKILQVIEICTKMAGTISHEITDYFDDEDDYASYIERFLDYGKEFEQYDISPSGKLKEFCTSKNIGDNSSIDIFYDGKNPILNRNIVLSKMYGSGDILADALSDNRVNIADIEAYYKCKDKLTKYRTTGEFSTKDEVVEIKKYQELKNHVEFRDIVEYAELLNELQGQLINWTYLRERDLLYYQLGFHYSCLKNDSNKPSDYKSIVVEGRTINNAILHQFASLYINGVPLFVLDGDEYKRDKEKSAGGNIRGFFDYCKIAFPEYTNKFTVYTSGLELFETVKEHDEIINLRNHIDHSKYFVMNPAVNGGRSMIDIYSEVFDRFFSYDHKYRKNVPNVLFNICMKHFAALSIGFSTGEKVVQRDKERKECKDRATIVINKISAEPFTYKLKNGKVECPAKSERFLRNMVSLLYYRDNIPEGIVYYTGKLKSVSPDNNGQKIDLRNSRNKGNNGYSKKNKTVGKKNEKDLTSNPFDDLFSGLKL